MQYTPPDEHWIAMCFQLFTIIIVVVVVVIIIIIIIIIDDSVALG